MLEDTTLYYFLFGSCIYWSCFLLCDFSMKKAISKIAVYAIIVGFYLGISALYFLTAFATMTFIEYIIGFLPFIIIPLLYKDSVANIIFTFFSSMLFSLMIHLSSNIVTNHIYTQVVTLNLIPNLTPDMLFHILNLVVMVLYILMILVLIKRPFRKMNEKMSSKVAFCACLYPVAAFIILLCDFVLLKDLTNMNANVITLSTMMLLMLIIYFILYYTITHGIKIASPISKEKNTEVRKEVISDPMDLLASGRHYYEMLLNHYMDLSHRTSDLDQHLQTMNSLLINDNIAGATVFMDRIVQNFHDHDLIAVSNNQSINLLMSYYMYQCKKEQIYIEPHLDIPSNIAIPDLDLCIIFGNCIENAIEACRFVKNEANRFINIDCKIQNNCLMIIMDNSFDGFINKVNNQLITRKKFGGIGLKMVEAVVGKYHGTIDMEYPQNVFSIFVKLQLNGANKTEDSALPTTVPANRGGRENRKSRTRTT